MFHLENGPKTQVDVRDIPHQCFKCRVILTVRQGMTWMWTGRDKNGNPIGVWVCLKCVNGA
ncbi:MAG: hypothetical protein AAB923_00565 [Patescibacteria group bacterium]